MQAERYTIAWFVWPRDGAVIQGPRKRYPPTTMRDFMKVQASQEFLEGLTLCVPFKLTLAFTGTHYTNAHPSCNDSCPGLEDGVHI